MRGQQGNDGEDLLGCLVGFGACRLTLASAAYGNSSSTTRPPVPLAQPPQPPQLPPIIPPKAILDVNIRRVNFDQVCV